MPFTLSHPAAVLPLRRSGLPMAALVCGSVAPDLHMLVPGLSDAATHRWQAIPTIDLALGYALTAFWVLVLAAPVRAALPRSVSERLEPPTTFDARAWLLAIPGVIVGAVTHLGLDTFAHADLWGGRHVPWLYEKHLGHAGYEWSQYGLSVLGLVVILAWGVSVLRRDPGRRVADHPRARSARFALGVPMVLGVGLSLTLAAVALGYGVRSTDMLLYIALRGGLVVTTGLAFAGAAVWTLAGRRTLA